MRSKRPSRTIDASRAMARVALTRFPQSRATLSGTAASKSRRSIGRCQGSIGFSTRLLSKRSSSATPSRRSRSAMAPSRGRMTALWTTSGSRNFRIEWRLRPGPPLRAVSLMKRTRTLRARASEGGSEPGVAGTKLGAFIGCGCCEIRAARPARLASYQMAPRRPGVHRVRDFPRSRLLARESEWRRGLTRRKRSRIRASPERRALDAVWRRVELVRARQGSLGSGGMRTQRAHSRGVPVREVLRGAGGPRKGKARARRGQDEERKERKESGRTCAERVWVSAFWPWRDENRAKLPFKSVTGAAFNASPLAPGYKLDRYELLCPIAEGGMASVWVARQRGKHGFEKLVAIKTILPKFAADVRFQEMFLDEARIASRIEHANVAQIFDLGEENEILYLVMEYVEGDALSKLNRACQRSGIRIPTGVILRVLSDTCAGLHEAHEMRDGSGRPLEIVHRDVSPHNILVSTRGTAKLIDFGIATARSRAGAETSSGVLKGKIQYMAP